MSSSSSSLPPFYSFTTTAAFLPSQIEHISYTIPSDAPVQQQPTQPALAQNDHAVSTVSFFPPHSTCSGFVLARVVDNGYVLELRWMNLICGSRITAGTMLAAPGMEDENEEDEENPFYALDQAANDLPPIRFVFPARIVAEPFISLVAESKGALQMKAITEEGYLYSLTFDDPMLFYSNDFTRDEMWSMEYKVLNLQGRTPVLLHGVSEGSVIIACTDSYLLRVTNDGSTYHEVELRSNASFSVRSLLPSFSSRNISSAASSSSSQNSSPAQILSFSSAVPAEGTPFGVSVSRDRKLKIWNLDTGVCLRTTDLLQPAPRQEMKHDAEDAAPARSIVGGAGRALGKTLLPPQPRPLVRLIEDDQTTPPTCYLVLFVPPANSSPPTFSLYTILFDAAGLVSELAAVGARMCASSSASLVDFDVMRFNPATLESNGYRTQVEAWYLWTLWEEGGESEFRYVALPEFDAPAESDAAAIAMMDEDEEWTRIESGSTSGSIWTADHFDELLLADKYAVVDVFERHIFYPNRYSPSTLEYALEMYESTLMQELDPRSLPQALTNEYDTHSERLSAIVGCSVELEISPSTGAELPDLYAQRMKVEWLRFVALCNESRAAAMFPTAFAGSSARGLAFILMRDAIAAPVVQDTIAMLRRAERNEDDRIALAKQSEDSLDFAYPSIAQVAVRHELSIIFSIITLLESSLSSITLGLIETEVQSIVCSALTEDVEDVAHDLWDRVLLDSFDDALQSQVSKLLETLKSPEMCFASLLALLTTSELSRVPEPSTTDAGSPLSQLASALTTQHVAASMEARYRIVRGVVVILLFVYGVDVNLLRHLDSVINSTLATFHKLSLFNWIAQQTSVPPPPSSNADDGATFLLERFGDMRVTGDRNFDPAAAMPSSAPSYSLLNSLVRDRYAPLFSQGHAFPHALAGCANAFVASTGLIGQKLLISATPADVEFASALLQDRLPSLAGEFAERFADQIGMEYVGGLAKLAERRGSDMVERSQIENAFEKVAAAFYNERIRLDEDNGLANILPLDIAGSLAKYYRHVALIFVDYNLSSSVIKFARLAIDAHAIEFDYEGSDSSTEDLWLQLFKSQATLELYDAAYATLIAIPYPDIKSSCLAHLISVMCENGQVDRMNRYSFLGLQQELENNLLFRARNSDPSSQPNYYKILYAYHISKGDYRSAGAIMFQQARRIGELSLRSGGSAGEYAEMATIQCHSYLAATNALSLVETKHAWITIVAADEESINRSNKRRKLTSYIPEEEFDESMKDVEILELADIRREYTVVLSRLLLSNDFPELTRSNVSLDPEAVVALFSQTGEFDSAFSAAQTLDVDMSSLFETLTSKCVSLSLNGATDLDGASWITTNEEASTWEGSLAAKAWKVLQRHLERHDDGTYRYRQVVLIKTLEFDRTADLPEFLISFFLKQDCQFLIRSLIQFGRLSSAFRFSILSIQNSTSALPLQSTASSTSLPYSLFDILLALTPAESVELATEVLAERQSALRSALESRIAVIERATDNAVRSA